MRRQQLKIAKKHLDELEQTHSSICKALDSRDPSQAAELLQQCQAAAIQLGTLIEQCEGENFVTVGLLEDYCEIAYQVFTELEKGNVSSKAVHPLKKSLADIRKSVKKDIKLRLEVVFLPYKASMWDSLESVWRAAEADENCDAYVIPIPYYDRNPDLSFGAMHYEGNQYPADVPVTAYDAYDFDARHPDMIFIHNPYDECNFITSVPTFFYSRNLKKYTELLVYIPYFATTGGLGKGQRYCSAYHHVNYIVTQTKEHHKYFDPDIPQTKLLPLGSPKFDRVIHACSGDRPEPPKDWKPKLQGKRVYFYNTGVDDICGNPESFMKKLAYVFRCFEGREDVCLLWRPHPLLESAFDSRQPEYKTAYQRLKEEFIVREVGIYDDTPDFTRSIALSDAYFGGSITSVASMFGVAGKPVFVLKNAIHDAPQEDDWRGEVVGKFFPEADHDWLILQGNRLYHSETGGYQYRYCCDVSEYAFGSAYSFVVSIGGKHYACPASAQDILVVGKRGVEKRIPLKHCLEEGAAFCSAAVCGKYLLLIPSQYPAIVRYNAENGQISYFEKNLAVFIATVNHTQQLGGFCVQGDFLFLASPLNSQVLALHVPTGEETVYNTRPGAEQSSGCVAMLSDGEELWLLPRKGTTITKWNPKTREAEEYKDCPDGLLCTNPADGQACFERPFGAGVFCGKYVYFSPLWANMFIRLDRETGEMAEWKPPFEMPDEPPNAYYPSWAKSYFAGQAGEATYRLYSVFDGRLYEVNLKTNDWREIPVGFDLEELRVHEPGFCKCSSTLRYACMENAFNSLPTFLDGVTVGAPFDKQRQIQAYSEITENPDGTCGEKIYQTMCEKLRKKGGEME